MKVLVAWYWYAGNAPKPPYVDETARETKEVTTPKSSVLYDLCQALQCNQCNLWFGEWGPCGAPGTSSTSKSMWSLSEYQITAQRNLQLWLHYRIFLHMVQTPRGCWVTLSVTFLFVINLRVVLPCHWWLLLGFLIGPAHGCKLWAVFQGKVINPWANCRVHEACCCSSYSNSMHLTSGGK